MKNAKQAAAILTNEERMLKKYSKLENLKTSRIAKNKNITEKEKNDMKKKPSTQEFPYIDEISIEQLKGKPIIFIDPGKKNY